MSFEISTIENDGNYVRTFPSKFAKNESGLMYVFRVQTSDGQTAEVNKQSPVPPQKGDRYNKLEQPREGAPEGALPTLKERDGGGGGFRSGGGKDYRADDRGLRGKNASMAVAYAKDLAVAGKIEMGQISVYAERFYDFIESKAQVGE